MANSVTLGDDGIIVINVVGDQTQETVANMGRQVEVYLATLAAEKKPGLVLDNIVQLGQTDIAARQTVAMLARTLSYERIAMLGKGTAMRVGTNLLLKAIGMGSKVQYFESREEATKWLLGRQ